MSSIDPGTALVFGGAGAIAGAIARRLRDDGYRLVLVDVDEAGLERAAEALGCAVRTHAVDLSTPAGIHRAAGWLADEHADATLVVCAAGVIEPGDVRHLAPTELDRHVHVNLLAPMHLLRAAAIPMAARGSGDLVAIVSMGGILALAGSAAYSASKFGLRGFLTALRSELDPVGVRVMGIYPSGVDTPMLRHEALNGGSALNFVGRVHTAEDVADAVQRALRTGRLETYVPYADSISARLVATWPWAIGPLLGMFTRIGERGRAAFLADRGLAMHAGDRSSP